MNKRIKKKLYQKKMYRNFIKLHSPYLSDTIQRTRRIAIKKWYHKHFTVRDNRLYKRYRIIIRGYYITRRITTSIKLKNKKYQEYYHSTKQIAHLGKEKAIARMKTLFTTKEIPCGNKFMAFSKWGYNITLLPTNPKTESFYKSLRSM